LDWYAWAQKNGIDRSPFTTGAVEVAHLKAIVDESGIIIKPGDILFIRVGFTAKYNKLSVAEQEDFPNRQPGGLLGLEATRESLKWLWENGFAAIASDSPSFERGPATGPYNDPDVSIHQWALAGWGMPLGEMFDLEELAAACHERNRWTFFLCSLPMRVSVLSTIMKRNPFLALTNNDRFQKVLLHPETRLLFYRPVYELECSPSRQVNFAP
jgi:kynurenine formamidase